MWCHVFETLRPVYCINTPKPLRNKLQISPSFTVQQNYHNFHLERDRDWREAPIPPQGVTGFVLVRFYDREHIESSSLPSSASLLCLHLSSFQKLTSCTTRGQFHLPLIREVPAASTWPITVVTSLFFLPMWPYLINQRFKICFNLSSKCLTEPFIQNFFILGPIPYI